MNKIPCQFGFAYVYILLDNVQAADDLKKDYLISDVGNDEYSKTSSTKSE